jgi:hypothetical protein
MVLAGACSVVVVKLLEAEGAWTVKGSRSMTGLCSDMVVAALFEVAGNVLF